MKLFSKLAVAGVAFLLVFLFDAVIVPSAQAASAEKIRVLLLVGGHPYDTNEFFQIFKDNPEITFQVVEHPRADALLKAEAARDWDVLVLYDYWQKISEETKADLVARLKEGKGLVSLHHSIANYQDWPEFAKIIGARYYTKKTMVNGVEKARSQFKHGVEVPVKIANKKHPVTKGLEDFVIHDETYRLFDVASDVKVLLTTDEPTSESKIAWARTYGKARVVYLQNGHDRLAYQNPAYGKLVAQAIRWTARRK